MRLSQEPDLPPQINILPMIDVIFAILVFFIVSSLYLTRSEGLPVNLPQASTTEVQQTSPTTVSLDQAGQLTLNGEPVAIQQLKAEVSRLIDSGSSNTVIINADTTVSHGKVVDVMDQLRQLPTVKLAIAAKSQTPEP